MPVAVVVAVLVVVVVVAGLVGLRRWAVRWIARVEADSAPVTDRVHRLRRASMASAFGGLGLIVVLNMVLAVTGHRSSTAARTGQPAHHTAAGVVTELVGLVVFLSLITAPALLVGLPARKAIGRLRGAETRMPGRARRVGLGMLIGLPVFAVTSAVNAATVHERGVVGFAVRVGAVIVTVILAQLLFAPVLLRALGATRMPADVEARLRRLAERAGVRVRGFRVLPGRGMRVANAVQVGALPGLRYVAVTDYLLDHLDPELQDAVVAHELGHAAEHHVAKKATAWAVCWIALSVGLTELSRGRSAPVAAAVGPLLILAAFIIAQGALGVRLETRADAYATNLVGAEPVADALEAIGRLNDTPTATGRWWNLLTQHPGLEQRIHAARTVANRRPHTAGSTS